MKSRKESKNIIHVNFNNYKKYNTYASISFEKLPKKINDHWTIIYDEPIWWLHYIVMILYKNLGRKLQEKITLKLRNYTDKNINWVETIFDKSNRYLKKVKLEILLDLEIIDYKKSGGRILLKFKKYSDQNEQIILTSNQLSSGEWQYVITTIFLIIKSDNLFENKSKIDDPIIFIDQPEDNFDPLLSTTIIENYIEIFPPSTQFFVATHLPFIIKKIIDDYPDNCLLYDFNTYKQVPIVNNKKTNTGDKFIYYVDNENWFFSLHEINYLIFGIVSFEYFLELYYTIFAKLKDIYPHKDEEIKNNVTCKLRALDKDKKQLDDEKTRLQQEKDEVREKNTKFEKKLEVIVHNELIVSKLLQLHDKTVKIGVIFLPNLMVKLEKIVKKRQIIGN